MKHLLSICICLLLLLGSAIDTQAQTRKEANKLRPSYLELGLGNDRSTLRDFGTSPLVYEATARDMSIFYHRFDEEKETRFGLNFISGMYESKVGDQEALGQVQTWMFTYSKLFQLKGLSSEKWNYKVGGTARLTGNIRINTALQNAALGLEIFNNIMASGKVTRDISRTEAKSGKFLFFNYDWKPRVRNLAFQLDVGLLNSNYRNGYTYVNQSGVLNDGKIFEGYEMNTFSGFRMSSAFDYTVWLMNGNAYRISYLWDAYTSGGDVDQFEASHHTLKFALLFSFKK